MLIYERLVFSKKKMNDPFLFPQTEFRWDNYGSQEMQKKEEERKGPRRTNYNNQNGPCMHQWAFLSSSSSRLWIFFVLFSKEQKQTNKQKTTRGIAISIPQHRSCCFTYHLKKHSTKRRKEEEEEEGDGWMIPYSRHQGQ